MAAWKVRVLVVIFEGILSKLGGRKGAIVLIENDKNSVLLKHRLKNLTVEGTDIRAIVLGGNLEEQFDIGVLDCVICRLIAWF